MDEYNSMGATSRDLSRQDATINDTDYTLSLEEIAAFYQKAGHPRTLRSLQRYCANGHLDARKITTPTGDKYLVTPLSVARHIAQTKEFAELESVATGLDMSRQVATAAAHEITTGSHVTEPDTKETKEVNHASLSSDLSRPVATDPVYETPQPASNIEPAQTPKPDAATSGDTPRLVAPAPAGESSRYVAHLERQLEVARDERDFLREQIDRKDRTIDALIERDRETNYLVRGLQEMLTPLLGGRRRETPPEHPSH
jgi:hypothetical protein